MTGIDIISRVSSGKLGHQAGWSVGSLHLKLLRPGLVSLAVQSRPLAPVAGRAVKPGLSRLETGLSILLTSYPPLALVPVSRGPWARRVVI